MGNKLCCKAIKLLDEALARDPHFCAPMVFSSRLHIDFYWQGFDHTAARRELARAALDRAAQFNPDAGRSSSARANYPYKGFRDYDRRAR